MPNRDDHFKIDTTQFADQVVNLGLAFGFEYRLVEVEECIGGESHLFADGCHRNRDRYGDRSWGGSRRWSCGRRSDWRRRRCLHRHCLRRCAVAILFRSGRGPKRIAPAQFVGAVLPGQVVRINPVVNRLGRYARHARRESSSCKKRRHLVQFFHIFPLEGRRRNFCETSNLESKPVPRNPSLRT